jgi:hypothetical protein
MAVSSTSRATSADIWPELPLDTWEDTLLTLQRWMQMVGKVKLALCPPINHWWHATFFVTPRGLTTSVIPYGPFTFQMTFDFMIHELRIETSLGASGSVALAPRSVAEFYDEFMTALHSLGIDVSIWSTPVEVEDRTPFEDDCRHASYDREYVDRFRRVLIHADRVLNVFRSRFQGKVSPVHFFWGAMDLATTRFSGRIAPPHPGSPNVGRAVMLDAYSHEVSSCGFWPGTGFGKPAFYSYAYPEPAGYKQQPVKPKDASYNPDAGEFLLPYDAVRTADSPDSVLLAFLQSTYDAAANCAKWDRKALERPEQLHRATVGLETRRP